MRYREVIHAPVWLLAITYLLFLSLVVSIWAALGNSPAIGALIVLSGGLIYLYFKTALIIEIDENELRVGSAHIERQYISTSLTLDKNAMQRIRTRDADPSAFLAIRFWTSEGVKVQLNDSRDSTPYWLISTKNKEQVVQGLMP